MGYIKGIDISNNNSSIDFSVVAGDGVEYVYLKQLKVIHLKIVRWKNSIMNVKVII